MIWWGSPKDPSGSGETDAEKTESVMLPATRAVMPPPVWASVGGGGADGELAAKGFEDCPVMVLKMPLKFWEKPVRILVLTTSPPRRTWLIERSTKTLELSAPRLAWSLLRTWVTIS